VGTIIPHENWRGQFARGTWGAGMYQGMTSDCPTGGASNCFPLSWPGYRTNAWHQSSKSGDAEHWMGSLVNGMRDATGQIYMRNRYYDPHTGQFTQTDPIGLAGGLNTYGFAAGDPVSYSDPYGLFTCPGDPGCPPSVNTRVAQFGAAGLAFGTAAGVACTVGTGGVCAAGPAEMMPVAGGMVGAVYGAGVGIIENTAVAVAPVAGRVVESVRARLRKLILAGGLSIGFGDAALGTNLTDTTPTNPCGDRVEAECQSDRERGIDTVPAPQQPKKREPE
jgi:RHS repeat-associated protein